MKSTDFRPEHFPNGYNFNREVFNSYLLASDKLAKGMYTKYLPCVFGGIIISFFFSKGVGGFIGNILALVCIFGGLILGTAVNAKTSKEVKECAAKLGITNADVKQARKHLKEGTFAWTAGKSFIAPDQQF